MKPQPTEAMIEAAMRVYFKATPDSIENVIREILTAALDSAWRPISEYPHDGQPYLFHPSQGRPTHFIPRSVLGEPE